MNETLFVYPLPEKSQESGNKAVPKAEDVDITISLGKESRTPFKGSSAATIVHVESQSKLTDGETDSRKKSTPSYEDVAKLILEEDGSVRIDEQKSGKELFHPVEDRHKYKAGKTEDINKDCELNCQNICVLC